MNPLSIFFDKKDDFINHSTKWVLQNIYSSEMHKGTILHSVLSCFFTFYPYQLWKFSFSILGIARCIKIKE